MAPRFVIRMLGNRNDPQVHPEVPIQISSDNLENYKDSSSVIISKCNKHQQRSKDSASDSGSAAEPQVAPQQKRRFFSSINRAVKRLFIGMKELALGSRRSKRREGRNTSLTRDNGSSSSDSDSGSFVKSSRSGSATLVGQAFTSGEQEVNYHMLRLEELLKAAELETMNLADEELDTIPISSEILDAMRTLDGLLDQSIAATLPQNHIFCTALSGGAVGIQDITKAVLSQEDLNLGLLFKSTESLKISRSRGNKVAQLIAMFESSSQSDSQSYSHSSSLSRSRSKSPTNSRNHINRPGRALSSYSTAATNISSEC